MSKVSVLKHLRMLQQELKERFREVEECIERVELLLAEELPDMSVAVLDPEWDHLVDTAGALNILNIAPSTLSRYKLGQIPDGRPPFPKPEKYKGRTPYWRRDDLVLWSRC